MAHDDEALLVKLLENADLVHPATSLSATPFDRTLLTPLLWLGNRRVAEDARLLRLMRATHVLNCAPSQVPCALEGAEGAPRYHSLDLRDAPIVADDGSVSFDASAPELFERGAAFIEEEICTTSR